MKPKLSSQISVKLTPDMLQSLNEIREDHAIEPVELARRLLLEAVKFKKRHKRFGFPVIIAPTPYPSFQFIMDFFSDNVPGEEGYRLAQKFAETLDQYQQEEGA